jgi:transcriptional regulator with XRE-family HTH domain
MEVKAFFGANLKHYRKVKHLSQEQLSEKVNISVKHLSKIERGLTFISADLLDKLSDNLGISVAKLFCNSNENIYDNSIIDKFDRISEKHLIKALEGIKADIRENCVDINAEEYFVHLR